MIEVPIQEESNNEDVLATVAKKLCEITEKHAEIFRAGYDAGLIGAKTLSLFETYRAEAMKEAKAYTDKQLNSIMGEGASETLDTIGEIAQVLGNDENVINKIFFELYNHTHYADYPSIDEFNNLAGDYHTHNHDSEYARQGHEHPEYASDTEFKELAYDYNNHTHDEFNDITTHTNAIADLQQSQNTIEEEVATNTTDIYKSTQAIANLQKNALYIKDKEASVKVEGDYESKDGKYTKSTTVYVDGFVLGVLVSATVGDGSADKVEIESTVTPPSATEVSATKMTKAQTSITFTGYVGLSTAGDMEFTYTVYYIGV